MHYSCSRHKTQDEINLPRSLKVSVFLSSLNPVILTASRGLTLSLNTWNEETVTR